MISYRLIEQNSPKLKNSIVHWCVLITAFIFHGTFQTERDRSKGKKVIASTPSIVFLLNWLQNLIHQLWVRNLYKIIISNYFLFSSSNKTQPLLAAYTTMSFSLSFPVIVEVSLPNIKIRNPI